MTYIANIAKFRVILTRDCIIFYHTVFVSSIVNQIFSFYQNTIFKVRKHTYDASNIISIVRNQTSDVRKILSDNRKIVSEVRKHCSDSCKIIAESCNMFSDLGFCKQKFNVI